MNENHLSQIKEINERIEIIRKKQDDLQIEMDSLKNDKDVLCDKIKNGINPDVYHPYIFTYSLLNLDSYWCLEYIETHSLINIRRVKGGETRFMIFLSDCMSVSNILIINDFWELICNTFEQNEFIINVKLHRHVIRYNKNTHVCEYIQPQTSNYKFKLLCRGSLIDILCYLRNSI